jgi:hypothetical protein
MWSLLSLRLPRELIDSRPLPFANISDVPLFIQTHNLSVIAYANSPWAVEFLDYPYLRYSDRISFLFVNSTKEEANCTSLPCFRAYRNGLAVEIEEPSHSSVSFSNWCEKLLNAEALIVHCPDFLRTLFDRLTVALFGVGEDKRPEKVPESVPFYVVEGSDLGALNLSVDRGVYLYRPKDRQLVEFQGDIEEESKTPIKNGEDDFQTREFFAGYFIGPPDSASDPNLASSILLNLSASHSDKFDFVMFNRDEAKKVVAAGKLGRLQFPFIFAFRSGNLTAGRWYVEGPDAHNLTFVDAWLKRIANGEENYSVLAAPVVEEPPSVLFRQVNALTVERAVLDRSKVTVLLIASLFCSHCREFKPYVWAAADVMVDWPARFYWIDGPTNDIPAGLLPEYGDYPVLFVWPAGENFETPVLYHGAHSVKDIVYFVVEKSGLNLPRPYIDSEDVEMLLMRYRSIVAKQGSQGR